MRRGLFSALVMGVTVVWCAAFAASAAAADPTLYIAATRRDANGAVVSINPAVDRTGAVQPALLLPGEYVIVTGLGFPAGQPVQAELVVGAQRFPLAFQNLTTAQRQPVTDTNGAFQDLAFALPAPGQVTSASGQLVVTAGQASFQTPVAVVIEASERGDQLAVGFGVGFTIVAALLILVMLRGLPTYPKRAVSGQRSAVSNGQ